MNENAPSTIESISFSPPDMQRMQSVLRDRTAQEIRDWISIQVQLLHRHELTLCSLHNSTLPYKVLPREILVKIFRYALPAQGGLRRITKAMGVCQHWRDTILDTPLLWNDIDLLLNTKFLELCLARSRDANVAIRIPRESKRNGAIAMHHLSTVVPLLTPHHSRITRVDFDLDTISIPRALQQILEAPLPMLRSMTVDSDAEKLSSLRLTQNHLPNLRDLLLAGTTLDSWTTWPLPNLTSLVLSDHALPRASDGCRSRLASLLDVLAACRSLESFEYEQWNRCPGLQVATTDRIVTLPSSVRHFSLISRLRGDISAILEHVSLPRQARLSLNLMVPQSRDPEYASMFAAALPSDVTHLPLARTRRVTVWPANPKLYIWADEHRRFSFAEQPDYPATDVVPDLSMQCYLPTRGSQEYEYALCGVMRELSTFLPSSVDSFTINGALHSVDTETWDHMLAAFPCIERLKFLSSVAGVKNLSSTLKPTASVVPCPCLLELCLCCTLDEDDVYREVFHDLHAVLYERDKARSRLKLLSVEVKPKADNTSPDLATGLSVIFQEIEQELKSVVDSVVFDYAAIQRRP